MLWMAQLFLKNLKVRFKIVLHYTYSLLRCRISYLLDNENITNTNNMVDFEMNDNCSCKFRKHLPESDNTMCYLPSEYCLLRIIITLWLKFYVKFTKDTWILLWWNTYVNNKRCFFHHIWYAIQCNVAVVMICSIFAKFMAFWAINWIFCFITSDQSNLELWLLIINLFASW